jgi:putative endonuclease
MWFSRKQVAKSVPSAAALQAQASPGQVTTKSRGDAAEAAARAYLAKAGLVLVETNYRTPGRGGGEIDLIMRAPDGTLVFVEVRQRSGASHGGAGASISPAKRQRVVFAASHYLMRFGSPPPCRFDVVLGDGPQDNGAAPVIEWLPGAFDAS